ncbi:hypothetical protein F2Q69_00055754 [Brassica cretica]|uniref:Uncharacterized protein n=1 Tax=Brassica cretica TaxID=69181 RepID=A0A8S9MXG0_BRACR|nr:hypothetical protein F2Q69_00055754 [Brassica cretica]
MKNGEMKQSKKLLEDIAGIAGNCLTVCPSQEGKIRLHLWIRACGVLDIWSHHRGLLRQCPQESPLANDQILMDGQKGIEIMISKLSKGGISGILDKISQAAREESQDNSLIRWWSKDICVDSLPNHVVFGGVSCLSVQRHKVMLKCNLFKNIKGCVESLSSSDDWMAGHVQSSSGTKRVQGWSAQCTWVESKAKEEINLQKDVQVSIQALEQIRDFDSKVKLGSQLKTIDEVEAYAGLKKIMKEFQAWLKVELREVRRDKRRQVDAEDEQACSSIKRCRHKVKGLYTHDRESNDLVNHIGGVFRYFIVDVVDPGSTQNVARCGRELGEQFLSHEQG